MPSMQYGTLSPISNSPHPASVSSKGCCSTVRSGTAKLECSWNSTCSKCGSKCDICIRGCNAPATRKSDRQENCSGVVYLLDAVSQVLTLGASHIHSPFVCRRFCGLQAPAAHVREVRWAVSEAPVMCDTNGRGTVPTFLPRFHATVPNTMGQTISSPLTRDSPLCRQHSAACKGEFCWRTAVH